MNALNKTLLKIALLIMVLLAAVITAAVYTNGFESVSPLYITDGERVINNSISVPQGGVNLFLKRAGFNKSIGTYTVEILPNTEYSFDYTADGIYYRYPATADGLTSAFEIDRSEGCITIKSGSFKSILSDLHDGAEIEYEELPQGYPFILIITAEDNKQVKLYFRAGDNVNAISITLSPDHIIFGAAPDIPDEPEEPAEPGEPEEIPAEPDTPEPTEPDEPEEPAEELTENAKTFINYVRMACVVHNNPLVGAMQNAQNSYSALSEEEKNLSDVQTAYSAFELLNEEYLSTGGAISSETQDKAKTILAAIEE